MSSFSQGELYPGLWKRRPVFRGGFGIKGWSWYTPALNGNVYIYIIYIYIYIIYIYIIYIYIYIFRNFCYISHRHPFYPICFEKYWIKIRCRYALPFVLSITRLLHYEFYPHDPPPVLKGKGWYKYHMI